MSSRSVFNHIPFRHVTFTGQSQRQAAAPTANCTPASTSLLAEVERLMKAARGGRCGHRYFTMILVAHRHGLRASEIADLEWSQVEPGRAATLQVRRRKNGKLGAHPLRGDEVRRAARF